MFPLPFVYVSLNEYRALPSNPIQSSNRALFPGNAEKYQFLVSEAPVPRRNKILGYVLVCLKRKLSGFPANTTGY